MKDDIPAGESTFSHINACPKELLDFVTRPRLRVIFIDRIDFDGMGSDLALAEFSELYYSWERSIPSSSLI